MRKIVRCVPRSQNGDGQSKSSDISVLVLQTIFRCVPKARGRDGSLKIRRICPFLVFANIFRSRTLRDKNGMVHRVNLTNIWQKVGALDELRTEHLKRMQEPWKKKVRLYPSVRILPSMPTSPFGVVASPGKRKRQPLKN